MTKDKDSQVARVANSRIVSAHRGNELPHLESLNHHRIYALFFFLFLPQPVRTEEPLSQPTHRGENAPAFPSLSAVGKVPGDSAESPSTLEFPIFRSERLQRKATATKHSRFTPVRFALFVGRKCSSGESDVFPVLCLVFLSWLTGTDELPCLRPLCDRPLILCPSSSSKYGGYAKI